MKIIKICSINTDCYYFRNGQCDHASGCRTCKLYKPTDY